MRCHLRPQRLGGFTYTAASLGNPLCCRLSKSIWGTLSQGCIQTDSSLYRLLRLPNSYVLYGELRNSGCELRALSHSVILTAHEGQDCSLGVMCSPDVYSRNACRGRVHGRPYVRLNGSLLLRAPVTVIVFGEKDRESRESICSMLYIP
jgi:hypothetical protein